MSSIKRAPHRLKREKTLTIPRHFIFFDTETDQVSLEDGSIRQDFKLGWAVYYRRKYGRHLETTTWYEYDTEAKFWQFVFDTIQPKQRLWIIARNIVFDFTVVKGWHYLRKEGYKLKFFHNSGTCVIVTVTKGNKSLVFLDSMNWFRESLAKTGERIGIPKMEIDFADCSLAELSVYCKNDVLIELENFKLFIRFLTANSISRLCYTIPSTAMAAYLFRHYHTNIWIHNNKEAIELERSAYKGGRCECFYIGDLSNETYYTFDVNSLYPSVMQNNLYPVKYNQIKHGISTETLRQKLDELSCVAHVSLETTEAAYAIKKDRTIFPIGKFDAVLCTPEIKYALDHGHIKEVYHCVFYEQADIFTSYVHTMYQLRQEFKAAKVAEYQNLCKLLMNSLYGKFGQKAENWVKIGDCPNEPDREEILLTDEYPRVKRLRFLLGQVFQMKGYGEAYNSFPAIAAHVTAYARMYLYHLMQVCGEGNFVYCDTDSLIVNEHGKENLQPYLDDKELGKLKHEETITCLVIRGLKDYSTNSKTVVKGVRKSAIQVAESTYRQESWPTFKGTLKTDNANQYTVTHVTKHLSRQYTKGNVTESGKVIPFLL